MVAKGLQGNLFEPIRAGMTATIRVIPFQRL
jgi:hypothetical protein